MWEKILDHLDENDLFPLALSCKYFRQKQKELVARTGQSGPGSGKPRLALKTNLDRTFEESQPASADYLRFCIKEKVPSEGVPLRAKRIMRLLAAYHGYLPLLQELQKECELDAAVFMSACLGGHLAIMKWLRSEGCPWDASACEWAASGGHLDMLKWLRSEGCPWDEDILCTRAAGGGHLDVLKWLRSEGCPWNKDACEGAANGGHLDVLKWLRSEDCPWNERTCERAAYGGHLNVLRYARGNECPWDVRTCRMAAKKGHLDVLKYAHLNGCPWDLNACTYAAESVREWLIIERKAREAEAENAQRLDKLQQEIWEKILDDVGDNDLFPLALSCRYFYRMQNVREELLRIKWMKIERMMKVTEDAGESYFLLLLCFGF